MPIYEYRCAACGFQKEYLQKMNAAPLTDCPECGKPEFSKMVTAAGFHLKGSGWYATDFKHGAKPKSAPETTAAANKEGQAEAKTQDKSQDKPAAGSDGKSADAKSAPEPAAKKSDAAAPAAASGASPVN